MSTDNPADQGFRPGPGGVGWVRNSYELQFVETEDHTHTPRQRKKYTPETIEQAMHHLKTFILDGMKEKEKQTILSQFMSDYRENKGTNHKKDEDILTDLLNQYRTSECVIVSTLQGFRS